MGQGDVAYTQFFLQAAMCTGFGFFAPMRMGAAGIRPEERRVILHRRAFLDEHLVAPQHEHADRHVPQAEAMGFQLAAGLEAAVDPGGYRCHIGGGGGGHVACAVSGERAGIPQGIGRPALTIKVLVWNENVHERKNEIVAGVYPDGIHGAIAEFLGTQDDFTVETAVLQDPEHGLSEERLARTDVLLWWGHAAHGDVADEIAARVVRHVWSGMGAIFLHSAHFAKPFKSLMGAPCNLTWREAGERERLWVTSRNHPITAGLPDHFTLENEEMYGEPFGVPEPLETVFISWFQGGEVFRSGLTWKRGAGNVFYFRPGHETYPTYRDENVQKVLCNAVRWAHDPQPRIAAVEDAPNVPIETAPEPLEARGPRLHGDGEEGFR